MNKKKVFLVAIYLFLLCVIPLNVYAITYYVRFNNNGGVGTMSNQTFTTDEEKYLTTNTFTRSGYDFIGWNSNSSGTGTWYMPSKKVKNLSNTDGAIVDIYAQWMESNQGSITTGGSQFPKDTVGNYSYENYKNHTVNVVVNNGTVDQASKTIEYYTNATFTLTPSTNYGNPTVSCTNSQSASITNNTLTVTSVSNNTTCTVTYELQGYQVNVVISPSAAGSVSPSSRMISAGESGTFTVTPNLGYGNGTVSCTNSQTATLPLKAATTTLSITPTSSTTCTITYQNVGTVTVSLNVTNGSLTGASSKTITKGGEARFDVQPNSNYGFVIPTTGEEVSFVYCVVNGEEDYGNYTGIYGNSSATKLLLRTVTSAGNETDGITTNASCTLQYEKISNFSYETNDYIPTVMGSGGGLCCASSFTWVSSSNYFTISGTGISQGPRGSDPPKTTNGKWCGVSSDQKYYHGENPTYTTGVSCSGQFYYIYKITSCSQVSTTDSNYCVYTKSSGSGLTGELLVGGVKVNDSLF